MDERLRIIIHKDNNGNNYYKIQIGNKRTLHAIEDYYRCNGKEIEEIAKMDDTNSYFFLQKQTKINRKYSLGKELLKNNPNELTTSSIKCAIKHFDNVFVLPKVDEKEAFILCKLGKQIGREVFEGCRIFPFRKLISASNSEMCASMCFEKFKVINSVSEYLPLVYYSNSVRYKDVLKKTAGRIEKLVNDNHKKIEKNIELHNDVNAFFEKRNELLKDYRNLLPSNGNIRYIDCINFNKNCVNLQNIAIRLEIEISFYLEKNSGDIETNYDDLQESRNDCVFYRGLTDLKYNCLPKIFRDPTYLALEDTTYREYKMRFPDKFRDKTTIESITLMQHFGCPTRLLDVTTNPLAALFMSCYNGFSSEKEKDSFGEIITFFPRLVDNDNEVKYYDSKRIALLSCFSRLDIREKKSLLLCCRSVIVRKSTIKEFIELDFGASTSKKTISHVSSVQDSRIEKGKTAAKRLLSIVAQEHKLDCSDVLCSDLLKSYYVKTPLNNERIRAQSGCFILCGLDKNYVDEHFSSSRNEPDFYRIIVKDKQNILSELQQLNIHQASMMPDMVNVADYLTKNKY